MSDQDPMLGDEATRNAYLEKIRQFMYDTVEQVRQERRQSPNLDDSNPVMLGQVGMPDGLTSSISNR